MHFTSLLLISVIGASAHPSGHAHLHRHAHQKRDPMPRPEPAVGDLVTATIEGKVVTWTNTYDGKGSPFIKQDKPASSEAPAAPAPSSPAAAAAQPPVAAATSTPSSGSGSGKGVTQYTPFCNGASTAAKLKRATAAQIAYKGNTGTADNWGCNFQLVANSAVADQYKYTAKFSGASTSQACTCFNKIGPKGLIDGFWFEAVSWTLAPGETQYVAFDANTQGGCVCNAGPTLRKTKDGQFAGTWLEMDVENTSNGGWSGADISSLVPQAYDMQVDGMQVCFAGTCSTILPGGQGINAYTKGMEAEDGVGLNIPPGKVQFDVKVQYSG